jgi:hypothetical protein
MPGELGGRRTRRRFPTREQAEMWVKESESIREIEGLKTRGHRVEQSGQPNLFFCEERLSK